MVNRFLPMPRRSSSPTSPGGQDHLLVGLMGVVSMAIIGYAMVHMRQMDEQYRTLISLGPSWRRALAAPACCWANPSGWCTLRTARQGTASPGEAAAAAHPAAEFETELNDIARVCRTRPRLDGFALAPAREGV